MQFINDKGEPVDLAPEEGTDGVVDETSSGETSDREKYVTLEAIAQLGWETHRAWEGIIGEQPSLPWGELTEARQEEIKHGVAFILKNPTAPVSAQHDYWRAMQREKGAIVSAASMADFDELPWSQQMKARLWRHIVHAVVG